MQRLLTPLAQLLESLALGLLLSLLSLTAFAQGKSVSLSYVSYPPYYGESLVKGGPITEIIVTAFKRQGYDVKLEQLPWSRAYEWTKEGKYDGIYTAWYRAEREEHFAFSSPLPANEIVLFKQKDRHIKYSDYSDLKPYTIGVVRGYANPQGFDEAGLKLAAVTSDKQNMLKLSSDRIDLALADKALGMHIIRTHLPEMESKLDWLEPPLKVDEQFLMFSKQASNYEAKLQDFNDGLKQITDSGELEAILTRHGM